MERVKLPNAQQFQISISSDVSNLGAVAAFISNIAEINGLDDGTVYHIQMAVDEAVTNVIEHAYQGRTDGRIDIRCQFSGRNFIVDIDDYGKPFDAGKVPFPRIKGPLEKRNVGGLGIFFMKKLMDRVEFSSGRGSGNHVRMVKKVR